MNLPNDQVLEDALFLSQFENIARNGHLKLKNFKLNLPYIKPVLQEISKMVAHVLNLEKENGTVHVQPDLSSKQTTAECDFLIGNTIFDFKCLFSIVAPMKSMERSLIQYILYAAMANDQENKLNKNYGPINGIVILMPLQKQIIHFDISGLPFDKIRKAYFL